MKKKTVFVYKSYWEEGNEFEGGVSVRLFDTLEKACKALKNDTKQIKAMFLSEYHEENLNSVETDTRVDIGANNFDDYWCGNVYEKEVE